MSKIKKAHVTLYNVLFTVMIPLCVLIIMEMLVRCFTGVHLIDSQVDFITLMRRVVTSFCFALGLNCNLALGRMDLSAGSQMYLACILGGNLAMNLTGSLGEAAEGIFILLLSMLVGAFAGALVGFLYVKLRILPMVLGLGVALVYECISFIVNNNQGLIMYGKGRVLSNWWFLGITVIVVMAVMTYLFQYSYFGFNRRAIRGNQKLAADVGINIYSNAVVCYILAGVLVAIAGIFTTVYETRLYPVLGMSSNSYVFVNLFPMAVGMWLARKTNPVVGIFVGALSVQLLILGLGKFSVIGMSSYMQTCIRYLCWLVFTIYRMNEDRFGYAKERKERIALAKATRATMAAAG